MLKSRWLVGCLSFVIVVAVAVALRIQYLNTIPEAPIYGHSTLINKLSQNSPGVFYPLITYYYKSSDAPEQVIQFYSQDGACKQIEERFICNGRATPFGEYTAYIDSTQTPVDHQITYILEIRWEKVI